MFRICVHQLKHAFVSPKFYTALLIGIVVQLVTTAPLYEYASAIGEPLCVVDGFLFFNSDFFSVAAASLGTVLLVADIPFTSQNETYTLLRVSRRKWICGKSLYLLCICAIYYIVMFFTSVIYIADNAYLKDIWSQPLYILTQDSSGTYLSQYGLYYRYPYLLSAYKPFQAFSTSMLMSVVYAFVLSQFIFWLNLKFSSSMGYFIAIMYHFMNYFMVTIFPTTVMQKYSLLAYTSLNYHRYELIESSHHLLSVSQCLILLMVVSVTLFALVTKAVNKYDFKITVGARQ